MNMTGAATGAAGRGQWGGSNAASVSCNPRKFSEKIALQIQRQAEDIAAFQEVMTDITSTRIQAQRVLQARSLASYYGGSLPNVSQISACLAGNQRQLLSNSDYIASQQQHVRTEHGPRDHRPSMHGRPNRRHLDSAPYLSVHMSPPSSASYRRNCLVRSANEKRQMDQTPITALSRTRSDSALHTSVRMAYIGDPNPEQAVIGCSRNAGTPLFSPPVPLIEEHVQEEGRTPKFQKIPSSFSVCDAPGNHISGSLPDLSSLCLPSAAPEASNPQPLINNNNPISSSIGIHHLLSSATHEIPTDSGFPLPGLPSSLQEVANNPSLQPSLSNPNLQATLSSPLLHDSLSSTSLCTSLSSSSLKSSFSSQSLQSSFSSSSLSNQSFQSTASICSYSSGIGVSRSCSSSSLSGSPRTSGQVTVSQTTSSVKRNQLSPLIVPNGEESLWTQPTLSPTLSCIIQGVPLNNTKVRQEVKPPPYPYSQFPPTWTTKVHNSSQSWQHYQSEGWDQCRLSTRWCQPQGSKRISSQCKPQQHYMHDQNPPCQTQDTPYHYIPQQQLDKQTLHVPQQYQQTQRNYQSEQQPISCTQAQQYVQPQAQQFPTRQLDQCWNPQLQIVNPNQNQLQYQNNDTSPQSQQPFHYYPSVLEAQDQYTSCYKQLHQQNSSNIQRSYMTVKKRPKLQSKKLVRETEREKAHGSKADPSTSSPDDKFRLHNIPYVGLHLTPSQTEALSQKLGQLQKVTRSSDCQDVKGKHLCDGDVWNSLSQSYSNDVSCSFPSIGCAVSSACLDDVISDLPFSVPEFDLDPFILAD